MNKTLTSPAFSEDPGYLAFTRERLQNPCPLFYRMRADDPGHGRLRKLLNQAFGPRMLASLKLQIESLRLFSMNCRVMNLSTSSKNCVPHSR